MYVKGKNVSFPFVLFKMPYYVWFPFFPMKASSIELPEESCKPRPVVVSETGGHKPYHILVYRCSGTCDVNIPPSQKPCTAATKKAIEVEVTDPLGKDRKTIKIYNHTSCGCDCSLDCNWAEGEEPDEENCLCRKGPTAGEFGGERKPGVTPSIVCDYCNSDV